MTVRKLKNELIRLDKYGYGDIDVGMFAHDHDTEKMNEGVGSVFSVRFVEREDESEIIALQT